MGILKSLKKRKPPINPRFSIEQIREMNPDYGMDNRPKKFDPNTDRLSPGTDLSTAVDDRGVPIFTDPGFDRGLRKLSPKTDPGFDGRKIRPPRTLPPSRTPLLPPKYNPNQMSLVQGAPATNQLASIYGGGPSLASLINPPRTDPGGQEDMDKLMEMQRQSFRRFLAPPPGETPPPGTTPPGTTSPVGPPVLPPDLPGIPGIGIPGIPGAPNVPGIGGIPELPFDIDAFRDSIIEGIKIPSQPVIDQEALIQELQGKINIPQVDLSSIQEQIDKLQGGIVDIPVFDPSNIQAQIDALSNRDIPTFDLSNIQSQIDALSNRDIPTFDPSDIQAQIDALSNREVPTFDPTGLQAQIAAMEKRLANIPIYDPNVSIPPKAVSMPAMRIGKNLGGMVGMLPDD